MTSGSTHDLHLDVLACGLAQCHTQALDVLVAQRHGTADLGDLVRALGNRELHELVDDLLELTGTARHHHGEHQRLGGGERLALEQVLDHRDLAGERQVRIGERQPQFVGGVVGAREAEELVLHLGQVALGPRRPRGTPWRRTRRGRWSRSRQLLPTCAM